MSSSGSEFQHPDRPEGTIVHSESGDPLTRVTYEKDQIVFPEGENSTDAFVVESGRIGVFKSTDGKSVRLGVLEKGAIFGEMAAVTGATRSATAVALETSVVVRISRTIVQNKLSGCDPFVKALIHILINNLGRINERYAVHHQVA